MAAVWSAMMLLTISSWLSSSAHFSSSETRVVVTTLTRFATTGSVEISEPDFFAPSATTSASAVGLKTR